MNYPDLNHLAFQQHLRQSGDIVWFVARWLWSQGNTVTVNKMVIAPKHKQWKAYADHGDLEIVKDGYKQRVEVKGLKVSFTGARDWPYPDFIVCAKHSFDHANPKPAFYIIVGADRRALAVVDTKNVTKWGIVTRIDSRYHKVEQDFYTCPLDKIHWRRL